MTALTAAWQPSDVFLCHPAGDGEVLAKGHERGILQAVRQQGTRILALGDGGLCRGEDGQAQRPSGPTHKHHRAHVQVGQIPVPQTSAMSRATR